MENEPGEMCEGCGRKRATHYLCQPGAEPPSINLCDECMKKHAPALVRELMEDLKAGRCRFCGGQAAATDTFARLIDGAGAEEKFLCRSCCGEYYRAASGYFDSPSELVDSKAEERLREIMEQIDSHMRRWVIQRDN